MLRILLGLMIIIIGFEGMLAQTFTLFDVDRSQFPRLKAKFYLTDEYGNSISSISKNDLFIDEDGVPRQVLSVSCPPVKPALAVSSVLVMDASGSMGGPNIAMAKIGAAAYIKSLRNPQSETAITLFDDKNYLVTDFMTDRNFLLNKINEIYYNKLGWTDYNAALIAPPSGALQLLQYSRHKKVVLFLSDGAPTTITEVSRIVDQALLQKVKIYSIAINMSISKDMKEIATKTGGLWYDNVDSEEKARKIYEEILELEQGNESPCEIEWMSDYACSPKNVNVNVTENMTGQYYNLEYEVPEHGVVGLIFEPQSISMSGVGVSQSKDTVIKAIAVNRDFYINSIVGDANVFSIKPEIDTVYAGDTVEFTITYTPKDSNFVMCEFKVRSDKCPISVFATGGFPGKAPTLPSLRLTHPNGGEVFVAGSDTVITWTGLALSDTVMLEYSTNRGTDWNVITKSATNLVYNWKNIPKTPSIECLVRATQINNAGFDDHIFTGGRQLVEKGTRILRDNTGNLIIIGSFTGTTTIGNRSIISRGGYDIFVAKFGPVGNTHWVISAGGSGNDYGKDIDVDLFNNIYITGEFSNQANFGPHLVTSKGGSDVFAAKIDPAGNFQWVNSGGGLGNDIGAGIASDRNGNIAITGGFEGVAQFSSKDLFSIGNYDAFIVKYNSNGNLQWARSGGGAGKVIGKDVCDDKDGNITIVGEYTSTAVFGTQMINSQSRGEEDIFVLKYDPTGNMIWAKSYGGPGNDIPNAIDCDSEGNTTIAGAFRGIIQLTNKPKESRQYDAFVFKLNPSGNVIWANYGGGPGNDAAHGVASDFDGSIAITGYFTDEAQFALDSLTGFGARDVFAVKYNNNGDLLWSRAAGSSADDTGNGVTFDRDSRVSIIGDFQKRIFFGDNYRDAYGNGDFFIWRTKITYIQEDLSDSLFSIVMPLPQAIDVDMKQVLTGTSKDSVVSNLVQNLGTYQLKVDDIFFRGADAQSFSIVSGFPAFNVPPHENGQVELRFAPTREGNHTAEMIFIIQSDTIIRNIRGSGIRPMLKIVNPVIDFGKVEVDDSKDTIQAITIRNVGSAILYIDSTKHGLPNYTDFSTLSGGGKFQLNPGQEHTMDLRFTARDKGFTTGSLEFYYSAPGSPAVVQLFAEGIDLNPFISYELEPFVDLICENVDDKTLTIYNTGVNDLIISSIEIQGDDASDFTIDNIYNDVIPQGDSSTIMVRFNPQSSGIKNAEIVLNSNARNMPELRIPIYGNKESVHLSAERTEYVLGFVCPGIGKDTSIVIRNDGSVAVEAVLSGADGFIIHQNNLYLLPGAEYNVKISLMPDMNEKLINSVLIIKDDKCNFEQTVNLSAGIQAPRASADDIVIHTYSGKSAIGTININNMGLKDLYIDVLPTLPQNFEFLPVTLPIVIPTGESESLGINYTPEEIGTEQIQLNFDFQPCDAKFDMMVTTITESAGALIELPHVFAYSGEIVNIPISIKNMSNIIESGITGFDIRIKYNRTLLSPIGVNPVKIDANYSEIFLENIEISGEDILTDLKFIAGLGNAESSVLEIVEIKPVGGAIVNIMTQNGRFDLLGICIEGGTRLFNPDGQAGINSINPNPAVSEIEIVVGIIEKGTTELNIIDMNGKKIENIILNNDIGEVKLKLNTSKYNSGVYIIHYRSGNISHSERFIIAK